MANYTPQPRAQMLARLQHILPAVVDEMDDRLQQQEEAPTLLEVERLVQRMLQPLAREMVVGLVQQRAGADALAALPNAASRATMRPGIAKAILRARCICGAATWTRVNRVSS